MTRRQISRRAMDEQHKKLMLAYRNARGGSRTSAWKALRDYVTGELGSLSPRSVNARSQNTQGRLQ